MHVNFTEPEELLAEDSFYGWYLKGDEAAIAQWDSWIKQSPQNEALVNEAVVLLKELRMKEGSIPGAQVEAAYHKFKDNLPVAGNGRGRVAGLPVRRWGMIAAAVVILAVAGTGLMKYMGFFAPTAETKYGQIKEQRLPDGSEVTLNAHSKISYFSDWKDGKDREVWIKGEAFFHVQKTPQKSRFIVHTSRFDIVVTGTRFNVMNRDGITNVLLQEGSVTVHTKDGKDIYMKPGDFVSVNDNGPDKKPADAGAITAWKEKKMVFENTTLQEAARMIEAHYGVQVILADSIVAAKTINGIQSNDNLETLLAAIEAADDVKAERNGNTIIIKNH